MGKAVLVERDIDDAQLLLQALDSRGLIMDTWAWAFYRESGSWMLNVATPLADSHGLEGSILSIITAVSDLDISSFSFLDLNVFRDSDSFTKVMRARAKEVLLANDWYYIFDGTDLDNLYIYRCFSQVEEHRGFYLGTEPAPRRAATDTVTVRIYPPVQPYHRGIALQPKHGLLPFTRTLAITDEAAAGRQLLDRTGSQARVWAFLTERGLDYAKRIIDLVLDRHVTSVIPERELLLTSEVADFPFAAQDDAALLEAEFASPSRV